MFESQKSIRPFIEMGAKGYFPLIPSEWISPQNSFASLASVTGQEDIKKISEIFERLRMQKTLSRKETVMLSLQEEERDLFTRALLLMAENKALDQCRELQ